MGWMSDDYSGSVAWDTPRSQEEALRAQAAAKAAWEAGAGERKLAREKYLCDQMRVAQEVLAWQRRQKQAAIERLARKGKRPSPDWIRYTDTRIKMAEAALAKAMEDIEKFIQEDA